MEAATIAAARLEGHDHSAHDAQEDKAGQPANSDPKSKVDPQETRKGASTVNEADDKAEKIAAASSPQQNAEKRKAASY